MVNRNEKYLVWNNDKKQEHGDSKGGFCILQGKGNQFPVEVVSYVSLSAALKEPPHSPFRSYHSKSSLDKGSKQPSDFLHP